MAYPLKLKSKKCNCNKREKNERIKDKLTIINKNGRKTNITKLHKMLISNLISFINAVSATFENEELIDIPEAESLKIALNDAKIATIKIKSGAISSKELTIAVEALTEATKAYSNAVKD